MIVSRWRLHSQHVIQGVMAEYKGSDEKELRSLISAAYPYGERSHHPYKIWLSQVSENMKLWNAGVRFPVQKEVGLFDASNK